MYCSNCGFPMKSDYCIHCGYTKNGNYIDTKKETDSPLLEYYFGKKYDYYVRNQNWLVVGILGPTYIFSHNYFFVGLFLYVLDLCITLFFLSFNHIFAFYWLIVVLNITYFILSRYVWSTIGNSIYLKLLSKQLEKIKRNYSQNYKDIIQDSYRLDNMLTVFKYIVYGLISLVLFLILKNYLYSYLNFLFILG